MKSKETLLWIFYGKCSDNNVTYSNISEFKIKPGKTRLNLYKMNILHAQQQKSITCSSHFENDSQIILSWSEILAPLKSIAVLSELHYHLSLYDCQLFSQWNKISKKEYYLQRIFIHSNIQACISSKFFIIMTDLTFIFRSYKNSRCLTRQNGKDRKDNDSITMLFRRGKCIPVGLGSFLLSALLERTASLWNSQYPIAVVVLFHSKITETNYR